jgi:phosphoribosylformimino-5-aminoimidazole carboxamide ribotide isomerase
LKTQQLVRTATERFGLHVAVGIDSYERKVATQGWVKRNNIDFIDLAKMMEEIGVKYYYLYRYPKRRNIGGTFFGSS